MTETCPFCHADVPNGAIVCRGCGANKRPSIDAGRVGCGTLIFILMGFGMLDTKWWPLGVLLIAACAALMIYAFRKAKQLVWVRSMR